MSNHSLSLRKSSLVQIVLLAMSAILNAAAWLSPAFSDWYVRVIFPVITAPLAHMTSLLPFSVGEWLLLAAAIWLLLLLLCAAGLLLTLPHRHRRPAACGNLSARFRSGTVPRFLRATSWMISVVLLIMTLNCLLLYHVTPLENSLPGYGTAYTVSELAGLRYYVVEKCNDMALQVPRDENGNLIFEEGETAMAWTAGDAVAALSERALSGSGEDSVAVFHRLDGWSATAKPLFFSSFVSQQHIQGYFFPFTMEANYNTIMQTAHQPFTMCHELSHTHGFIYEDEANLIGFLACIYADDIVFQYSGWISVLNYVNNSFYENVTESVYYSHTVISDQVWSDSHFLTEETWEEVEETAVLSTETVKSATDAYLDTALKINGVEDGKASYSHVVELLLMYFDGDYSR